MKYDTVPSEILLESFKELKCRERVRARIVCKEWREIIDENRSLWRSLRCSVKTSDDTEPRAVILFDEKSQSSLEDVWIHMTKVADHSAERQNKVLKTLFNTLGKSSQTLRSIILKAGDTDQVKDMVSEVLSNCPKLNTFMFIDSRYFHSKTVIFPRKGSDKSSTVKTSELQVLWTDLSSNSFLARPTLLENLVSLAVEWCLLASEWREILQASASSLKHLQICVREAEEEEGQSAISRLKFSNLEVFEVRCNDKRFPEWMVFPSTTRLVLLYCDIKENLPSVSELWVSWLSKALNLGKCCPSLRELRITGKLDDWDRRAILEVLQEREKQIAIGFEVAGVKMVPLKRIVLPFKYCNGGFLDEVRALVEQVVDLAEIPKKIPVCI